MNNRPTIKAFLILAAAALLAGGAAAETFVSFNGGFYITYPDAWGQIDYRTAEFYLSRGGENENTDFEAVFAERAAYALFQGQYLVLTVDTIGAMTTPRIDSVLSELTDEFGREIEKMGAADILTEFNAEVIAYDTANRIATIESEVSGDDTGSRTNLLAMKFYEGGIANFYFYAPSPEYTASLPAYKGILASFSTEDIESALGREELHVADIEDSGVSANKILLMGGGIILLILIVVIARKKGGSKKA